MESDRTAGEQPQPANPAQPQQQQPPPPPQAPKGNGAAPPEKIERIDLATLKDMSVGALTKIAKQLDVPGATQNGSPVPAMGATLAPKPLWAARSMPASASVAAISGGTAARAPSATGAS